MMHELDANGIEETNRSICTTIEDFMDDIELTDELRIKRIQRTRSIRKNCSEIFRSLHYIQKMDKPDATLIRQSCNKIMSLFIGGEGGIPIACVQIFPLLLELMAMRELDANKINRICKWISSYVEDMVFDKENKNSEYEIESTEPDTEMNGEKESESILPTVIDFLLVKAPEAKVLSVFKDPRSIEPNINELYRKRFGCTMLHRAVENNFINVAELLLDCDVDQLLYNSSSQLPLSIAIDNRYDEMAALLVSKLTNVVVRRLFGDKMPIAGHCEEDQQHFIEPMFKINLLILEQLDKTLLQVLESFVEKGKDDLFTVHIKFLDTDDNGREPNETDYNCKDSTTFQTLANPPKKDALNHPVTRIYVEHKWKCWYQRIFVFKFCMYLFGLFCLTYSAVTAVTSPDVQTYDTPLQYSRAIMEVISYLYALGDLIKEIVQMFREKGQYFASFFNYMEIVSSILIILVLPLRYTHLRAHWYVFASGFFMWAIRIFKYGFVFSQTSVYAEVIKRILVQDFVQFSILMLVINTIFSGTFLLVLKADDSLDAHIDTSTFQGILYVGVRTLIEAEPIVDYTGSDGYRVAGTIVMLVYLFVTIVVMLNILIAQLSETYKRTYDECMENVYTNRVKTIEQAMSNEGNSYLSGLLSWRQYYTGIKHNVDMKKFEKNCLRLKDILSEIEIIRKKQTDIVSEQKTVTANVKQFSEKIEHKLDHLMTIVNSAILSKAK